MFAFYSQINMSDSVCKHNEMFNPELNQIFPGYYTTNTLNGTYKKEHPPQDDINVVFDFYVSVANRRYKWDSKSLKILEDIKELMKNNG